MNFVIFYSLFKSLSHYLLISRLMHGEEDPQEERAEAAALFAEYAIDFAAQGVRSALLAALAAMDQQMNCEEQQGKEHPV